MLAVDLEDRRSEKLLGNIQAVHRLVMSGFPRVAGQPARQTLQVLYRFEAFADEFFVRVRAAESGRWLDLPPFVRIMDERDAEVPMKDVVTVAFSLDANTVKRAGLRSGPRVFLETEAEQLEWLRRHTEALGLEIEVAGSVVVPMPCRHGEGRTIKVTRFVGRARVRDHALFEQALHQGVGPAKAYGCGMLITG